MPNLILAEHILLLHFLDCYDLLRLLMLADSHLTEGASPNNMQRLEVFYANFRPPIALGLQTQQLLLGPVFLLVLMLLQVQHLLLVCLDLIGRRRLAVSLGLKD